MIKSITEQLKQDLQKYESVPERIESLKDRYLTKEKLVILYQENFIKEL